MLVTWLAKLALVSLLSDPTACGAQCVPADYLMTCVERHPATETAGELREACHDDYEQMTREVSRAKR